MRRVFGTFTATPMLVIGGALLTTFAVVAGVTHLVRNDLDRQSRLINFSARGRAGTEPDAFLLAFVVADQPQTVVVRAQPVSLPGKESVAAGADLLLRIVRNADGVDVARSEHWRTAGNERFLSDLKPYVPTDPRNPACIVTLAPGGYSALVEDRSGAHAAVWVEAFVIRP